MGLKLLGRRVSCFNEASLCYLWVWLVVFTIVIVAILIVIIITMFVVVIITMLTVINMALFSYQAGSTAITTATDSFSTATDSSIRFIYDSLLFAGAIII